MIYSSYCSSQKVVSFIGMGIDHFNYGAELENVQQIFSTCIESGINFFEFPDLRKFKQYSQAVVDSFKSLISQDLRIYISADIVIEESSGFTDCVELALENFEIEKFDFLNCYISPEILKDSSKLKTVLSQLAFLKDTHKVDSIVLSVENEIAFDSLLNEGLFSGVKLNSEFNNFSFGQLAQERNLGLFLDEKYNNGFVNRLTVADASRLWNDKYDVNVNVLNFSNPEEVKIVTELLDGF
ncbi:MAG: hypothetical protein JXR63_06745 [Spirochaetales bacterium]|nr:hypothetical protein [Spirochaetales bacterium]